jgi:hypothetical protein
MSYVTRDSRIVHTVFRRTVTINPPKLPHTHYVTYDMVDMFYLTLNTAATLVNNTVPTRRRLKYKCHWN